MALTNPTPSPASAPATVFGGSGAVAAARLPASQFPGNAPFHYMHYPHDWQFMPDTGEWLPGVRKIHVDPGVGGVSPKGNPDVAFAKIIRKGGIVIPLNSPQLGEFAGYCVGDLNDKGQTVWRDKWASVSRVGNRGYVEPGTEGADPGFRRFQRHLVAARLVPPLQDVVKRDLIAQHEARLADTIGRLGKDPNNAALAQRVADQEALLAAMKGEAPKSAPKRRRSRKGAPEASDGAEAS